MPGAARGLARSALVTAAINRQCHNELTHAQGFRNVDGDEVIMFKLFQERGLLFVGGPLCCLMAAVVRLLGVVKLL